MSEKSTNAEVRVDVNYANDLITDIFKAKSCNDHEARTIAQRLSGSNLVGHDSHGIARCRGMLNGWKEVGFFLI